MSRELDAEVAEKVMGWKLVTAYCRPKFKPSLDRPGTLLADYDDKGEHRQLVGPNGEVYWLDAEEMNRIELPVYSTDIAAAWMVVERMKELGYPFELGDSEEGYYATYWNETSAPVYGSSMPECICKAAIEAMGGNNA